MATVRCITAECGTDLGPLDLVCPRCRAPRPRRSGLRPSERLTTGVAGTPQQEDPASEPSGGCDHSYSDPGSIVCTVCGAPVPRPTGDRPPDLCLRTPWGEHRVETGATEVGREVGPFAAALAAHTSVSRRHAILQVTTSGRLLVTDVGSTNGTYRNGEQVTANAPVELRPGDVVSFSRKVSFRVEAVEAEIGT